MGVAAGCSLKGSADDLSILQPCTCCPSLVPCDGQLTAMAFVAMQYDCRPPDCPIRCIDMFWGSACLFLASALQPSYTPTAMNYDFALITLKNAASASAGFMGMIVGQGVVTMNLTTSGYPVSESMQVIQE